MPSPPPVKSMTDAELRRAREYYQGRFKLSPAQLDRLIEVEAEISRRLPDIHDPADR